MRRRKTLRWIIYIVLALVIFLIVFALFKHMYLNQRTLNQLLDNHDVQEHVKFTKMRFKNKKVVIKRLQGRYHVTHHVAARLAHLIAK